jgi:hypothetical protein
LHLAQVDAGTSIGVIQAFGGTPYLRCIRANNTCASPSALVSGNSIGGFYGSGYMATGYSSTRVAVILAAEENWSDTANGTKIGFWTTAPTTTTFSEKMVVAGSGAVTCVSTIQATNAKLTDLTDGYLPYHVSDASGFANSELSTNGQHMYFWGQAGDTKSNLGIGRTDQRNTNVGTNVLHIFDGSVPSGTLTNGCSIYSYLGELYTMDSGGAATLQTPHDNNGDWIFYSKNTVTGRVLKVDMEHILKALNKKFHWDFVHEYIERQGG